MTVDSELMTFKVYRPFLSKNSQLLHDKVLFTQDIAQSRIHMERAIRCIRESKIFDTIITLNIAGSVNHLFAVACLLSNNQNKALFKAWAQNLTELSCTVQIAYLVE